MNNELKYIYQIFKHKRFKRIVLIIVKLKILQNNYEQYNFDYDLIGHHPFEWDGKSILYDKPKKKNGLPMKEISFTKIYKFIPEEEIERRKQKSIEIYKRINMQIKLNMENKQENSNLTNWEDFLIKEYGEKGTSERDIFEADYEIFRNETLIKDKKNEIINHKETL